MSQIVLAVIVAVCAFLFYCGLRRIMRMILSRGAACGCGQDECSCGTEHHDKAECCCRDKQESQQDSTEAADELPPCCREQGKK